MKLIRQIETRILLVATLTGIAASTAACAAPPASEERGVSVAKLKAPRPMMRASASPASQELFGVSEWRIFRGKKDVVLTGYDEDGHAVKGVSVGFYAAENASDATLRARVLDGSAFAARHDYARGRTSLNKELPASTASFLKQALADVVVLRRAFAQTTTAAKASARTLGAGQQCGGDMMAIVSAALQCIQSTGGTNVDANAVAQCIAAAQSAASVGSACQGTGSIPFDPTQGGDPWGTGGGDPWGGGAGGDPYGGGAGGSDPWGGGAGGSDPWGGGAGGDPYGGGAGGSDPWGGGGGMPTGGWCNDPFGDGAACPSCSGGAGGGDIYSNPANGDVGGDMGGWGGGMGQDCFGAGY
ncbi:MAG: hypothetical protein KF764_20490 [Labilithrix sp.]|nr:hypothetical protein [Labilithrix sp.]